MITIDLSMKFVIMSWKEKRSKIEREFNADKTPYAFWVPISISRSFLLCTLISIFSLFCIVKGGINYSIEAMGGNRKMIELFSYDKLKK